ncbi:MAG: FlgD immunoglobulin-like domain containing protein, partial [Betaproteobacteria bacterium]
VWSLDGPSGSSFGSAIVPVGDANGDGYGDFVVGSNSYSNGQHKEGRVQLFLGGPGAVPTPGDSLESDQANANLGTSLAAGDVNGDRTVDFVAGAPEYSGTTSGAGRVYLLMNAGPAPRPPAYVDARLMVGGVTVARDTIDTAAGRDTVTVAADVSLSDGGAVDLELTDLDPSTPADMVRVDEVTEPSVTGTGPQGPVFALAGQRFVPAQGVKAFEALAYDPLAGKFASNGNLYDACGNRLSNGPDGPGIAWDPVTRKFWNISFDAVAQTWVVASWDTVTLSLTAQFTIPRVLSVPGTGPDTLEDARGLAVDSSAVYVVDAGPINLVPAANAWFKFTRTGTPVASLKGAGFAVNAFSDVVDDIAWSPLASPTAPGRLLVAVEHTGIVVLDTTGAVVDTFTWRAQNVETADRPSAFAGLALDPGSGDLFLADNDRSLAEHWVRVNDPGPTSYIVGDGNPMVLQRTGTACPQSVLWEPVPPVTMYCPTGASIFGLAYRSVDQRVYGIDYGDGTLWKFDPRTGRGVRVGPTFVISAWGLAYDTQRDRLYALEQGTGYGRVWSIDPRTARATPLPNVVGETPDDIAFEPNGGAIYGVADVSGNLDLIRIDRDTGIGTAVGPTRPARGLDYDPVRGTLVGLSVVDSLWSINAGTGAASLIGVVPSSVGWEGLAVVPVAPFGTTDVPRGPGAPQRFVALAAYPQPTRAGAHLTFALAVAGDVRLDLFDVGGRLLRRLAAGRMMAGAHTIDWDGRTSDGVPAAAGIYFARLSAGGRVVATRIVLIR